MKKGERRSGDRPSTHRDNYKNTSPVGGAASITIDSRLYRLDWFYRFLVHRWAVENLPRYGMIDVEVDSGDDPLLETEILESFVAQVTLDLPEGQWATLGKEMAA